MPTRKKPAAKTAVKFNLDEVRNLSPREVLRLNALQLAMNTPQINLEGSTGIVKAAAAYARFLTSEDA